MRNHPGIGVIGTESVRPRLMLEPLEPRLLLSAAVSVTVAAADPALAGEGDPNAISIDPIGLSSDPYNVTSIDGTTTIKNAELALSAQEVIDEWRLLFPDDPYVTWQKESPWDNLDRLQSPPAAVESIDGISLDIGRNEYESTSFVLTNLSDGPMDFEITYDPIGISTTLRRAVWVTADDGTEVNDALSLIDSGQVVIATGESLEIWITLHGNDVAPGQYDQAINILPQGLDPRVVDISVTVHDISLPDSMPLGLRYWEAIVPSWGFPPGVMDAYMEDLKSHYVNTASIHPDPVPRFAVDAGGELITDYTKLDETLDAYATLAPERFVFFWNAEAFFEPAENGRPEFMTPEWKSLFDPYLTGWVAHMADRGLGYDNFVMHPYDERLDANVIDMAQLINEVDPQVQVLVNAGSGTVEDIEAIAPYAHIWEPLLYHYLDAGGVNGSLSQAVSLDPNTAYTFSFYGKNGSANIYYDLIFDGSTARYAAEFDAGDWTQETYGFTTASDTTQVQIRFFPFVGNKTILIDDVVLSSGAGPNLVVNGDMETGSPPDSWSTASATVVANTTDPHSGGQCAEITNIPLPESPAEKAAKLLLTPNPNLLPYGDMERGGGPTTLPDGWYPTGSGDPRTGVSWDVPPGGGSQSLFIDSADYITDYAYAASEPVTELTDYTLSFWFKGGVRVEPRGSSGALLGAEHVTSASGGTEWSYFELTVSTDATSTGIDVYFYDLTGGDGPSLIDNVSLVAVEPDSRLFWTYANPQGVDPAKASPYDYYRMAVWRAWKEGMTGFAMWTYRDARWDSAGKGFNWAMVYRSDAADAPPEVSTQELVVPGKRWEATREGVEDYAYLHLLQSAISDSPLPPDSSVLQGARNVLAFWTEEVVDGADNDDAELADQAKTEIIGAILALSGATLIDDGGLGYAESGAGWGDGSMPGAFQGDYRYHFAGAGANTASWLFAGLDAGYYEVFTTWMAYSNRATDAPFEVFDGATPEATVITNQQVQPDDVFSLATGWESLGVYDIATGTLMVRLSDDADGVVIADAVRIEKLAAPPETRVRDDRDAGYVEGGSGWGTGNLAGAHMNDYRYHFAGAGANTASWSFNNVDAGVYEVYATWVPHANRAGNTPFTVYDGAAAEATVRASQKVVPDDLSAEGRGWERLGTFDISGGSVRVEVTDDANGVVIVDAARLVKVDSLPTEIVRDNWDAGYWEVGTWSTGSLPGNSYRWRTAGGGVNSANWTFASLASGDYEVFATWKAFSNRASDAPFEILDGLTSEGIVDVNQRVAPNDVAAGGRRWESLGTFTIDSGVVTVHLTDDADGIVIADAVRVEKVETAPTEWVTDNLDAGYAETGTGWYAGYKTEAVNGECRWHLGGSGANKAVWTFGGLEAGTYQVFATWTSSSLRATDAPYTILDGAAVETAVDVDQQTGPDDEEAAGVWWESLGTFSIDSGTLVVELSHDANGIVIADAIRLVRV